MLKIFFSWLNRKSDLSGMAFGAGVCLVPLFLNCENKLFLKKNHDDKVTVQQLQTPAAVATVARSGTDDVPIDLFVCPGGSLPCPLLDPKIKILIENCEKTLAKDCRSKSRVEEFVKEAGIPEVVLKPECPQMTSLVPLLMRQAMSVESETLLTIQPKTSVNVTAFVGNWYLVKFEDKNGWVQKTQNGEELLACAEGTKNVAQESSFSCFLDQTHFCKIKKLTFRESCVDKSFLPATSFLAGTKVTVTGRGCHWSGDQKTEYARIRVGGGQECFMKASLLSSGKIFHPCF